MTPPTGSALPCAEGPPDAAQWPVVSIPLNRARCDHIFAEAAARAAPIVGTNDPVRDARFAAVGDQALADYDRRRAPLKPNSRANPSPESPNPGDPSAFTIQGRIWSSRDGWLPDLPGRQ